MADPDKSGGHLSKKSHRLIACALAIALICAVSVIAIFSNYVNKNPYSPSRAAQLLHVQPPEQNRISEEVDISAFLPIKVTIEATSPHVIGSNRTDTHTTLSLTKNTTALEAIEATGMDVVVEQDEYGMFVKSINGLNGDELSGWIYKVNGEMPNMSSDKCILNDGDFVEWIYVNLE